VPYLWSEWYDVRIQFAGVSGGDEVRIFGDLQAPSFIALYRTGNASAARLASIAEAPSPNAGR